MKVWSLLVALVLLTARLSAQTQSLLVTFQWDPNPTTDNVASYNLTLDGQTTPVPAITDTTCNCITMRLAITPGKHTVTLTAINVALVSDDLLISLPSIQESDPVSGTFTWNGKPMKIKTVRLSTPK